MALTDCFIQPGQLQGLITCLRESENLTGVAVVACLLAVWLTVQLMLKQFTALPTVSFTSCYSPRWERR